MRHTILIVDDDPDTAQLAARALRRDYDVLVATTAGEAINILEAQQEIRQPVHILLSDQNMPGPSGSDLLREVRVRFGSVVRLLFTGGGDVTHLLNALNTRDAWRYCLKPKTWDAPEFLLFIAEACMQADNDNVISALAKTQDAVARLTADHMGTQKIVHRQAGSLHDIEERVDEVVGSQDEMHGRTLAQTAKLRQEVDVLKEIQGIASQNALQTKGQRIIKIFAGITAVFAIAEAAGKLWEISHPYVIRVFHLLTGTAQ